MKHKVDWGPGKTFYECEECHHKWTEISRHCESMSGSNCPNYDFEHMGDTFTHPIGFEKHYEWPTDGSGNLIKGYDYK